jgi:hypothetical protein
MIGNNACGTHLVAWGTTAAAVEELVVLLPGGSRVVAGAGTLPARLAAWERAHRGLIRAELPDWPRRGSGYAPQHLLPEHGSNLAHALAGNFGYQRGHESLSGALAERSLWLSVPCPARWCWPTTSAAGCRSPRPPAVVPNTWLSCLF